MPATLPVQTHDSPRDAATPSSRLLTEEVPCALCGGLAHDVLYTSEDQRYHDTPRETFRLVRCKRCGLRYLSPRPARAALVLFYPAAYYTPRIAVARKPARRRNRVASLARRVYPSHHHRQLVEKIAHVRRLTPPGGRVVEIGPGGGALLAALRDAGYRVRGTDIQPDVVRELREKLGLDVVLERDADGAIAPNSVDTVVLWNSFEHIPDPRTLLARLHAWLAPGGHIVLSVPNAAAIERRLFFPSSPCEDIPRHLYSYAPTTLRGMLTAGGFAGVRIRHVTRTSTSELQQWCAARLLRRRPPPLAARVAYHGLVLPVVWLLDRLWGALGRSHSMVASAQKPPEPL
jgi:2-polyprenyl-3-methyl-5-hydroxy-6-metoxy-1,4-benzoquinol methylase